MVMCVCVCVGLTYVGTWIRDRVCVCVCVDVISAFDWTSRDNTTKPFDVIPNNWFSKSSAASDNDTFIVYVPFSRKEWPNGSPQDKNVISSAASYLFIHLEPYSCHLHIHFIWFFNALSLVITTDNGYRYYKIVVVTTRILYNNILYSRLLVHRILVDIYTLCSRTWLTQISQIWRDGPKISSYPGIRVIQVRMY